MVIRPTVLYCNEDLDTDRKVQITGQRHEKWGSLDLMKDSALVQNKECGFEVYLRFYRYKL